MPGPVEFKEKYKGQMFGIDGVISLEVEQGTLVVGILHEQAEQRFRETFPTDQVPFPITFEHVEVEFHKRTGPYRPIPVGVECGDQDSSGTLGYFMTDGSDYYAISNAHVLDSSGTFFQPRDVSNPDSIGTVQGSEYNRVDAAWAKLRNSNRIAPLVYGTGEAIASGTLDPGQGDTVTYSLGRTGSTGTTTVAKASMDIDMGNDGGALNDVFRLSEGVSDNGDSGSPVLKRGSDGQLHPCGMVFGSVKYSGTWYTLACKAKYLLSDTPMTSFVTGEQVIGDSSGEPVGATNPLPSGWGSDGGNGGGGSNQKPVAQLEVAYNDKGVVQFSATGSFDWDGTIQSYEWDFGDGTTRTTQSDVETHEYSQDGSYTTTVTVTDDQGATDSASVSFTVSGTGSGSEPNQGPTARISQSPNPATAGETFELSGAQSTDPDGQITGYTWEFSGGATKQGETITHTFNSAGQASVTLTVTDDRGATDTANHTITVEPADSGGGGQDPPKQDPAKGGSLATPLLLAGGAYVFAKRFRK